MRGDAEGQVAMLHLRGERRRRNLSVLRPLPEDPQVKWLMLAACAGEKPSLFDFMTYPEASEALRICGNCRFTVECMDLVKPSKSSFDGVAAGVVWRNGYRVRPDNSTREDRLLRLRGEDAAATGVPEIYGQGTLPFD